MSMRRRAEDNLRTKAEKEIEGKQTQSRETGGRSDKGQSMGYRDAAGLRIAESVMFTPHRCTSMPGDVDFDADWPVDLGK
jgi:hypothetical protein